jgi:hypothetical protein
MHMSDICCVETICGSISRNYTVIIFVYIFEKVLFTAVILPNFCVT